MINNLSLVYGLDSIWTNELTKKKFDRNIYVDVSHNQKIISQYFKEDDVTGSFLENIVSAFHKI